ncbi:unnamed protein product, partial [Rotaria magnacalcarata]
CVISKCSIIEDEEVVTGVEDEDISEEDCGCWNEHEETLADAALVFDRITIAPMN